MAEFFGMSGVITVLISGVVLAHYNYYNLTVGGMHATTYFVIKLVLLFNQFLILLNLLFLFILISALLGMQVFGGK